MYNTLLDILHISTASVSLQLSVICICIFLVPGSIILGDRVSTVGGTSSGSRNVKWLTLYLCCLWTEMAEIWSPGTSFQDVWTFKISALSFVPAFKVMKVLVVYLVISSKRFITTYENIGDREDSRNFIKYVLTYLKWCAWRPDFSHFGWEKISTGPVTYNVLSRFQMNLLLQQKFSAFQFLSFATKLQLTQVVFFRY